MGEHCSHTFQPGGRRLAVSDGIKDVIRILPIDSKDEVQDLRGHVALDLRYTPDGRLLLSSGTDGNIRLWETGRVEGVHLLPGQASSNSDAAHFAPSGSLVAWITERTERSDSPVVL